MRTEYLKVQPIYSSHAQRGRSALRDTRLYYIDTRYRVIGRPEMY